jgi:SAM-dependent methyltransferase
MLKPFEYGYLLCSPFLPPLLRRVRRELFLALESSPACPAILDVGGRKSHYTIGLPGLVTVSDLPRVTEVQQKLNLGLTDRLQEETRSRRSNVKEVMYDDMTKTTLPPNSFDVIVAVEVLEHVAEDKAFVTNVARVLKPGGWFIMTTPNGDFVENTNPDHKRHYQREQLRVLLKSAFTEVQVVYAIQGGLFRKWGLRPWSPRQPFQTLLSMFGNVVNGIQSSDGKLNDRATGTRHLLACCQKTK